MRPITQKSDTDSSSFVTILNLIQIKKTEFSFGPLRCWDFLLPRLLIPAASIAAGQEPTGASLVLWAFSVNLTPAC